MSVSNSRKQARARDLKHRVLTCIHRLSDRDTHSAAASELESIAKTLSGDDIPSFISSIVATDTSDRSPVRRQCVRLISILSEHHGNFLSPYLSKILTAIVRRLRDPDSSVRSACVAASLALSSYVTSPPFISMTKPFLESLFTEQESSTQAGAALCVAAVVEGSGNLDAESLRRLLPKLEKLAKAESFKAKAALLTLIGSIVQVKGVLSNGGKNAVKNLVMRLMEFLSSEDWAARKAAAEALMKIALVEKEVLSEHKVSCLKTFETKRFDKVKATRETVSQMIEAWKEIPDLPDEVSPLPESEASSKENASDGCYPPGSKTWCSVVSARSPQVKNRSLPNRSTRRTLFADGSPVSATRKKSPLGGNENKGGRAMFQKLDRKKPLGMKVEIVASNGSCGADDSPLDKDEEERRQIEKAQTKRSLFGDNTGNLKLGLFKSRARVAPCGDSSVVVSNETGDICIAQKGCEDLSQIRKQLVQIENQQSSLLDLLQKFIGNTQNGMQSLEARVHGLELALDDISFDLAVSTGRISQSGAAGATCCRLPGADFLTSKLWRKAEYRLTSRPPVSGGTTSVAALPNSIADGERLPLGNRRYMLQGRRGLIVNPLAKISSGSSLGFPEVSSSGVVNNNGV